MVKSRAEPVKPVVSESESEEPQEENDGGSSTEGSESESEVQTTLAESGKQPEPESSSEEEEEDGSESESDSESDGPDANVQSSATKSVKSGPVKPASKPDAEPATPSKPVSLKRAPGEAKESQAKKQKQKQPEAENSEKKQLFQRLWSEEDEIAILKGMIEYAAKKKADPVADLNAFHEFIKKNIHIDVSRAQLQDKIRRLRKKYENNRGKEKEGKNRTFSKPHEQEAYELSKKVWSGESKLVAGSVVANGGASSKKKKSSEKVADVAEEAKDGNFARDMGDKAVALIAGGGTLEERIARMGDEAFKGGQGEGSKQWKSLKVKEIELYMAHLDVKKAQANLVLDLLKS